MKFKRTMEYKVKYLPNKRCRTERETFLSKDIELELQDLTEEEFPIAFIVHNYATVHEGAEDYMDFTERNCRGHQLYAEEIRTYHGKLYKPARVSWGAAISTVFEKNPNRVIHFPDSGCYMHHDDRYTSESVILSSFEEEKYSMLQKTCDCYKAFDGKIWKMTGEPCYWVTGGCVLIEYGIFDDYRLPVTHYSALDRDEMLSLVKNEASRKSYIEVKMPEMVKLYRPQYFNVTICCQAYYNSQIELPRDFSGNYEDALAYAKEHLDEIPIRELEYVSGSDSLDEENCSFDN